MVTDPDPVPVPDTNPNFESDVEVDDSSYEDYIENWDKMTEEELEDYFEEVGWIDDTKTTDTSSQGSIVTPTAITNAAYTIVAKYSTTDHKSSDGKYLARCNWGVRDVFKNLYNNSTELDNMKANDMVNYWNSSSNKWVSIAMSEAQSLANNGWFVVTGWVNTTGGNGHVSIVVPGEQVEGTWCKQRENVPVTMDVGSYKRETSIGINWCYGELKQPNVKFYYYKNN